MNSQFEENSEEEFEHILPHESEEISCSESLDTVQIQQLLRKGSFIRKFRNILTAVMMSLFVPSSLIWHFNIPLMMTAIALWVTMSLICGHAYQLVLKKLTDLPETVQDLRLIAFMIETISELDFKPTDLNNILELKLAHMLPKLSTEDLKKFSPYQRNVLCKAVCFERRPSRNYATYLKNHTEFVISGLDAIARIEDPRVIKKIHFLRRRTTDARIAQASQKCIDALVASAEQIHSSKTLLRSSQSNTPAKETLLRAAGIGSTTSADELLRASESEST